MAPEPRCRYIGSRDSERRPGRPWSIDLAANVYPKLVQEILGHANVGITLDLYAHVVPGMHAEATTRIAALIIGS